MEGRRITLRLRPNTCDRRPITQTKRRGPPRPRQRQEGKTTPLSSPLSLFEQIAKPDPPIVNSDDERTPGDRSPQRGSSNHGERSRRRREYPMIRNAAVETNPIRISGRSLLFALLCLLVPSAVNAQTEAIDLTDV